MTGTNEQKELSRLEQIEKEVNDLAKKAKELKESRDYWQKRHDDLSRKFNAFRENIKSVIVLVD